MTVTHLVTALADEIRLATANLRLPTEYHDDDEDSARQEVQVFEGYIPKDLFEQTTYYPCVVVELLELHDELQQSSTATIGLSFGVFAKKSDSWKDAFHLMEVVRQRLLSKRELAKRFRLTGDITWQTAQNQPAPFFFVYGELSYSVYLVQEPIPLERTVPADLLVTEKPKVLKVDAFRRKIK